MSYCFVERNAQTCLPLCADNLPNLDSLLLPSTVFNVCKLLSDDGLCDTERIPSHPVIGCY